MWLIVRRSSCTWLVDTNNILINDELCMYVPNEKRRKEKRKGKTETKEEWVGGRGPSQRSVRLNGCSYGTYLTTVHCRTCILYGLIAHVADHGKIVWKFQTRWNQWPWQVDKLTWVRLDLGVRSIVWPIVPNLFFDTSLSTSSASQPASQRTQVGWNDRIILITLSNNADSPRSQ